MARSGASPSVIHPALLPHDSLVARVLPLVSKSVDALPVLPEVAQRVIAAIHSGDENAIGALSAPQREALASYVAYQQLGADEAVAYFIENRELMASLGVDVDYALANAPTEETMRGYRLYKDPMPSFPAYGVLSETLTHDQALILFTEWVANGNRPPELEGWN